MPELRTLHFRVRDVSIVLALVLGMIPGAVPAYGTAPGTRKPVRNRAALPALPEPSPFRETEEHGYLAEAWINGTGPYTFAIDTGAGATILSDRIVATAGIKTAESRVELKGLTNTAGTATRETSGCRIDLGAPGNQLPCRTPLLVVTTLPEGVDGILDPTDAFAPYGFVLDVPGKELRAFDPKTAPLRTETFARHSVVVPWLGGRGDIRPFVALADGRRALIDTGSSLGFAVSERVAKTIGLRFDRPVRRLEVRDLAGGQIEAHRVAAATIQIGSMEFVGIPTDVLFGTSEETPILLGRDALRPFELTFDPVSRRVRIEARQP